MIDGKSRRASDVYCQFHVLCDVEKGDFVIVVDNPDGVFGVNCAITYREAGIRTWAALFDESRVIGVITEKGSSGSTVSGYIDVGMTKSCLGNI